MPDKGLNATDVASAFVMQPVYCPSPLNDTPIYVPVNSTALPWVTGVTRPSRQRESLGDRASKRPMEPRPVSSPVGHYSQEDPCYRNSFKAKERNTQIDMHWVCWWGQMQIMVERFRYVPFRIAPASVMPCLSFLSSENFQLAWTLPLSDLVHIYLPSHLLCSRGTPHNPNPSPSGLHFLKPCTLSTYCLVPVKLT